MHNGSVTDLMGVVNHYNSEIIPNPNLDSHLINFTNGTPLGMKLTSSERAALVAFLSTLTDTKIIQDEKFSSPFK